MKEKPHYLIIEPYYGGSHKAFITGLTKAVEGTFTSFTLPPRKWKLRMQLSAPHMAEKIIAARKKGEHFDAILTSTFIDVAVLRSMLTQEGISIALGIYFHENQLAYPIRPEDTDRYQFAAINCTSALCADAVAFNSRYNMESCLQGIERFTQKAADFPLPNLVEQIRSKSCVLYPGMDFSGIVSAEKANLRTQEKPPAIVWNHRWEHDKNPEEFFAALFELQESGRDFQLIIVGESFRNHPAIFDRAQKKLAGRILHFGYCPRKEEYFSLLAQGTIIVSTAFHEFFGMSVLEGVRAGCWPLVPDRLSYRELFPKQYRYATGQLKKSLAKLLDTKARMAEQERKQLTEAYSWTQMRDAYEDWLNQLRTKSSP
ncbi:DUF3524 domain-containing protein [Desulfobulbus rhabdoformis]|jgi:glycosyltransferase involved in cell wall biosynthesis|uniref:tRNA-queuosine alpha-mannosyltransferase domain-containing protein n=1 Tax=Desulfobulbus rhabdoformis TaxID=34032 RepID=UPI0019647D41|nr:DUF3524 domain-containing protein [Desulfobulbus rhabdoformis]MBM9613357.1 DUF3524 domain-containing protein [Desulfobulbus rhabdoformis]